MRIAFFDIEASNLNAPWGRVLCACIKPLGEDVMAFSCDDYKSYKKEPWNDAMLCQEVRDELREYDIVVTWYGRLFDVRYLNSRLARHRLMPLEPMKHIDLYFQARNKYRLGGNSLRAVARFLGVGLEKIDLEPEVWVEATALRKSALDMIVEHCVRDVEMTEAVYEVKAFRKMVERVTR